MLAVPFEGSRSIGKPVNMTDDECSSLEILQGVDDQGYPFTLSKWMPSKEDIEAINAGRGIWVRILTHNVHPISIMTLDETGNINQ